MPATEIAQVPGVHLEGGGFSADEGKSVAFKSGGERLDPCRLPDAGPDPRRWIPDPGPVPFRHSIRFLSYMESFSATFRIWIPCTRDAPPRIAAAT